MGAICMDLYLKTQRCRYEKHHEPLLEDVSAQLIFMSAATIDRLLKPIKARYGKGLSGTKPGSLLRKHIPISTNHWDSKQVGFMEADTVAHCGTSLMNIQLLNLSHFGSSIGITKRFFLNS